LLDQEGRIVEEERLGIVIDIGGDPAAINDDGILFELLLEELFPP
jgi:hypothetical protein